MQILDTALPGVYTIELDKLADERGHFARTFCEDEFSQAGLVIRFVQCSTSFNRTKGTLRGMHYQREPGAETKLVRCTRGTIFDVVVDLRVESPTRYQWLGVELSAGNGRALYIPQGFAHGFQTLEDDSEVYYMISERYAPALASGIPHDEPRLDIRWPLPVSSLSEKDAGWPSIA